MNNFQEFPRKAARKLLFTRMVAVITVSSLAVSSVAGPAAYAANTPLPGAAQKIRESLSAFQVPYSVGRITDAKYLGSKKVVIAIQDLHCHPEVQRNIAKLIGILEGKFGREPHSGGFTVFVEGGVGTVDTSWVNKVSDQKVREGAIETLMNAGRLTGSEYYSIKTGKHGLLQGMEDAKPYYENLARLNEIMNKRGEIGAKFPEINDALVKVKGLYYGGGNRRLDQIIAKHDARAMETEKYYKLLLKLGNRSQIDRYYYPATAAFLEIIALQRQLRHKSINKELTKFIGSLKEKVPFGVYSQLMEKANRPNGIEELYVTLAQIGAGMDLSEYPALSKFFTFVESNQKINPLDLVREERQLISELRGRLSKNRAEREVAFIADFLKYVQAYYENKMSADDYAFYMKNAAEFQQLWKRYARANLLPPLDAYKGLFSKFYGVNIERNKIFLEKIGVAAGAGGRPALTASSVEENIFLMNTQLSLAEAENEVAVVVTGGFHTQGLAKMLEEKGISYVVVTPSVTGDTTFAQRMYDIIAREFAAGRPAPAGSLPVVSPNVSARPADPAKDSLGLAAVSHAFEKMDAPAIEQYALKMGLQSAAVAAAVAGDSAKAIADDLKTDPRIREHNIAVTTDGDAVVFTFKDGHQVSVVVAADETSAAVTAVKPIEPRQSAPFLPDAQDVKVLSALLNSLKVRDITPIMLGYIAADPQGYPADFFDRARGFLAGFSPEATLSKLRADLDSGLLTKDKLQEGLLLLIGRLNVAAIQGLLEDAVSDNPADYPSNISEILTGFLALYSPGATLADVESDLALRLWTAEEPPSAGRMTLAKNRGKSQFRIALAEAWCFITNTRGFYAQHVLPAKTIFVFRKHSETGIVLNAGDLREQINAKLTHIERDLNNPLFVQFYAQLNAEKNMLEGYARLLDAAVSHRKEGKIDVERINRDLKRLAAVITTVYNKNVIEQGFGARYNTFVGQYNSQIGAAIGTIARSHWRAGAWAFVAMGFASVFNAYMPFTGSDVMFSLIVLVPAMAVFITNVSRHMQWNKLHAIYQLTVPGSAIKWIRVGPLGFPGLMDEKMGAREIGADNWKAIRDFNMSVKSRMDGNILRRAELKSDSPVLIEEFDMLSAYQRAAERILFQGMQAGIPQSARGQVTSILLLMRELSQWYAQNDTEVVKAYAVERRSTPSGEEIKWTQVGPLSFPALVDEKTAAKDISSANWSAIRAFNEQVRLRMNSNIARRNALKQDSPILIKEFEVLSAYQAAQDSILVPGVRFFSGERTAAQNPRGQVTSILVLMRELSQWYEQNAAELAGAYGQESRGVAAALPYAVDQTANVLPAGVSPAGKLTGYLRNAAEDLVADPIGRFPALNRGLHAVIAPRVTQRDVDEAAARATATGAQVVLFGAVENSEGYTAGAFGTGDSALLPMVRTVETTNGSVTIVAFEQGAMRDDAALTNAALVMADIYRGEAFAVAKHGVAVSDDYYGVRYAVLELKYMSPDQRVVDALMQNTSRKPVIIRGAEAVDGKNPTAHAGELAAVPGLQGYIDQLAYLNDRVVYRNSYTAPQAMVGAISPVQIHTAADVDKVVNADLIENARRNNIDTILIDLGRAVWDNPQVLAKVRAAQLTLRQAGLLMGFYEEVTADSVGNMRRFQAMVSLKTDAFGVPVVYLHNRAESAESAQNVKDIVNAIKAGNADATVLVQGVGADKARTVTTSLAQAADNGFVLATRDELQSLPADKRALETVLNKATKAAMIILGKDVTEEIQRESVTNVLAGSNKNVWGRIFEKFIAARSSDPAFSLAQGRSDGARGVLARADTAKAESVIASITGAALSRESLKKLAGAIAAYRKDAVGADGTVAEMLSALTIDLAITMENKDADIAYAVGYIEGVLEHYYANETVRMPGSDMPVELTPLYKSLYGKARLEQVVRGIQAQPADPIAALKNNKDERLRKIVEPVDPSMIEKMTAEAAATAAISAVDALLRHAQGPLTSSADQEMALAGVIELLRLYGERAIAKDVVIGQSMGVVPALVQQMLGAA